MLRKILILTSIFMCAFSGWASAQEAQPFRDFTFKRVKVPTGGTGSRITVQIDPEAQAAYLAIPERPKDLTIEKAPGPVPEATDTAYGWFWAGVSPSLADAGPGRLETALRFMSSNPQGRTVPAPRLQTLQEIAAGHGIDILKATVGTRVSPAFALAVIGIESAGRTDAVSGAGAVGLMQLIPATAKRFGVEDSTQPDQNISGGVAYLDWLMKEFGSDPIMVLAAYNAGENAVKRHEGVPPYEETRAYVPKVLAAWQVAKALCVTPPQLVSDGCVFAVREARNDG